MEAKQNQKKDEKEQPVQKSHLQVKYLPKGFFQLFNKNDTYIYEKKFNCDLPKNIIPPKSFHYPFSLENYCQSDLLSMDFDLNKNPEILTDSKINTLIHQDFINNTLELIFPKLTTISKKRTEEEQKFKKKILEIIERNDEVNQDINPVLDEIPDFLRRQTYLRPSTAVNVENKSKLKDKLKNEKKRMSQSELKAYIEQSFNEIDKVKEGMKHPDHKQKGVVAKKIYEVAPMDDMPNIKFVEFLFPTEPSQVCNLDDKYLKPEKFLIKMNKKNDISDETTCSFYVNNKLKTQEDHKDKDRSEYYSYETDFTVNQISQGDLFNRYFFILDRVNKKLKISRLTDKYTLRRYKRNLEEEVVYEDKHGNKKLGKKRRRNVITVPQSMEKEELDKKKKWISERGYNSKLVERKIESIDHSDANEIEKEKEIEEENRKKQIEIENENENEENNEQENEQEENNMEVEENEDDEDIFNLDEKDSAHEEGDNYKDDENENEEENQQNNEENDDEKNDNNSNNEENEQNSEKEEKEEKEENEEKEEKEEKDEKDKLIDDENGEDVFD
jgi:hypothetical protein